MCRYPAYLDEPEVRWVNSGVLLCRHQLDLLHPVSRKEEEMGLDLEHEISSLVVPTAYGTVIESARKTGR